MCLSLSLNAASSSTSLRGKLEAALSSGGLSALMIKNNTFKYNLKIKFLLISFNLNFKKSIKMPNQSTAFSF